ncbi:hypothetical protein BDR03DRAFT_948647 [Suillus americanus]|nr:hypothetical protein BDR03DRAFT_948647 [Suillus americanus]
MMQKHCPCSLLPSLGPEQLQDRGTRCARGTSRSADARVWAVRLHALQLLSWPSSRWPHTLSQSSPVHRSSGRKRDALAEV